MLSADEENQLLRALEVIHAQDRGFLVTQRPEKDVIYCVWGRWCDSEQAADVYARIQGDTAYVRLDMAPTGQPLSEQALQQAIVLLFGEEVLAIHLQHLRHRGGHGLSAAEIDRYFRCVGNGFPIMLIGSQEVPAQRAESVAEQLAKLARASVESGRALAQYH